MSEEKEQSFKSQSDEAAWAEWESTFRDARPVLPAAALERIEAAMQQEIARGAAKRIRPRSHFRWLWWGTIVCVMGVICWWLTPRMRAVWKNPEDKTRGARVEERIPLPASQRWLAAPARPIFPAGTHPLDLVRDTPATAADPLNEEVERAAALQPTVAHLRGLLALRWAHGGSNIEADPIGIALAKRGDPQTSPLFVLLCWKALGEGNERANLPQLLQALHETGGVDPWTTVFDLFQADAKGTDAQVQQALKLVRKPDGDPLANAKPDELNLLAEAGLSKASAGLDVLTQHRDSPWLALRELDEHLTARAARLQLARLTADATRTLAVRDMLRNAYVEQTSKTIATHCAALEIAGRDADAENLLRRARDIKYLNEPQDLAILLARLGEYRAWGQIINPLLADEISFIAHPPDSGTLVTPHPAELDISADAKHVDEGVVVYEPNVSITIDSIRVTCNRAKLFRGDDGSISLINASGSVTIEGLNQLKRAVADSCELNLSQWTVHLSGNVVETRIDGANHQTGDRMFMFDGRETRH